MLHGNTSRLNHQLPPQPMAVHVAAWNGRQDAMNGMDPRADLIPNHLAQVAYLSAYAQQAGEA